MSDIKLSLVETLALPLLVTLVAALLCWLITWVKHMRIVLQKQHVDRLEEYVFAWEDSDEKYPGAYTQELAEQRSLLDREREKLNRLQAKVLNRGPTV